MMNAAAQSKENTTNARLEYKRAMLTAELEQYQDDLVEVKELVSSLFPASEQVVLSLQNQFGTICESARTTLSKQAWEASRKLPTSKKALWPYFWGGLFLLNVVLMHFLVSLLLAALTVESVRRSRKKVRKFREEYVAKETAPSYARIDAIKGYALSLLHFNTEPSGNHKYPYNCTQVYPGQPDSLTTTWQINAERHGKQFGATFIGFRDDAKQNQETILLRLPENGYKMQFLEIRDKSLGVYVDVQKELFAMISRESSEIFSAITQLAEVAAKHRGMLKKVKLLKTKLENLDAQEKAWEKTWSNVAIDRKSLDEIRMQVELFKDGLPNAPRGLLLWGPPGTGKTSIARAMANSTGCSFFIVTEADLKGEFQGKTAPKVRAVWTKAREQAPCVIFIDECEGVFRMRGGGAGVNFDSELVQAFLAEWDGMNSVSGQVFVVGATNLREQIDTAIISRFGAMIEIGLPDMEARRRILEIEFAKSGIKIPVTDTMAKETSGMSGRDINTLVTRFQGVTLTQQPTEETFRQTIREVRGKSATAVEEVTWDEVVLQERLKAKLQSLGKKISRAEEYSKRGLPVPKSLLLYGPPGTGKTQIARALATESGIAFQAVSTAEIKGSFIGESGKRVKDLFSKARAQAPCLLFIDEIDIVTSARGSGDSYSKEIVGQLLQEMDGISSRDGTGLVFVIGATNCREDIDPAVLSRFADQEEIALPDVDARAQILRVLLASKPLGFDLEEVVLRLSEATEGYSGRDISSMVNAAASQAMQRADIEGIDIEDISINESDFSVFN